MSNSIFTYVFTPASVRANTRAGFTLVASNGASALNLTSSDEIYLALPVGGGASDLTPDLSDINPQAPANWRFSKAPSGGQYNFVISPVQPVSVPANAALVFTLANVIINPLPGTSTVRLQEFIGNGDATRSFSIDKSEAQLSIVVQATPSTIGRNQTTTLKWTATKAAYVTIAPLGIQVDTVGQRVTTPSKDVNPEAPQVTYTLTAWTPDQQSASASVTVTISAPVIDSFEPQRQPAIGYTDHVTLSWNTYYAEKVTLSLPQGEVQRPLQGSLDVQPYTMLQGNSSVATYTLRASGAGTPAQKLVRITFQPVAIDYFRYVAAGNTTDFEFHVSNGTGVVTPGSGYYQLTASGPAGPLVQYLGDYPALQIQLLQAGTAAAIAGTPFTLTWQTVQATAWALTANGQPVTIAQQANGQVTLTQAVASTYMLRVSDASGAELTSVLQVPMAA